ncbi:oxidoreductase, 2OG-Fe(II) oxygenase family protein [Bacteriovorax sp. BSW11_IV]|uniref:2OG-Fe(II) oxygenase n=1 Tax=Bacteriovorax sp. BSW11_IV TaxID=1353529 RepID=UPI00038A146C|nr:2OG-Fe(II) oxygenase [Bacteriovorax sp. BSW11_IV]EQC43009.1 oxidoreductase, 2OG-Fe(II) oxygenase family protein [Bacteriovorax sp. BSW11_IV]
MALIESFSTILESLETKKYFVGKRLIDQDFCHELTAYAQKQWEMDLFKKAETGRATNQKQRTNIRTDNIMWIESWDEIPQLGLYDEFLTSLREAVNYHFFQSLKRHESHFSLYKNGSFYKKHIDFHQDSKNRKITCILYLNTAPKGEGELIIYSPEDKMQVETVVAPESGTFVCFLSEDIYHEVTVSHDERWAITSWVRDDEMIF